MEDKYFIKTDEKRNNRIDREDLNIGLLEKIKMRGFIDTESFIKKYLHYLPNGCQNIFYSIISFENIFSYTKNCL